MSYEIFKENNKQSLPWIEKYRPSKMEDIISHTEIIKSLTNFIDAKALPHSLFYGPSGSGKTSTIICSAKRIYGEYMHCMVLRLNASNERGIETVRTKIKDFVSNKNSIFLPIEIRNIFKLVILDEIDSMTVEAQGMLRQTIEKNSSTTRFCLICNDIDRINIALQSRCTLFRFTPLSSQDMAQRLIEICKAEEIRHDKESINAIVKISKGDMRTAINTLQRVNLTINGKITINDIYKISGHCMPEVNEKIFDVLVKLSKEKENLYESIQEISEIIIDNNITIPDLLEELKNIVLESKFSKEQKIYLVDNFAENEIYDSRNVDSDDIIMILASLFFLVGKIKKIDNKN